MALEDILSLGAISIGEDIGSTLNSFGNLDGLFELPNTKFSLRIATKYFPAKGGAIVSQTDLKLFLSLILHRIQMTYSIINKLLVFTIQNVSDKERRFVETEEAEFVKEWHILLKREYKRS